MIAYFLWPTEGTLEAIFQYLDHFSPEFLIIESALLVIIVALFIVTWVYNRKKYHALKHQIPAGVVKDYLDSVIQNSVSLKSALFRGGGIEMGEGASIPQVVSLGGGDAEALAQKNSEIARLRKEIEDKNQMIASLKAGATSGGVDPSVAEENGRLKTKIKELEDELKTLRAQAKNQPAAAATGGDDSKLKSQLAEVTKERDELKAKLKEYEIIEDDLANLKRLQQENEQLKKALSGAGGGAPAQAAAVATQAPASAQASSEAESASDDSSGGPAPVEESVAAATEGEAKNPEDLLSEFEKMLG